MKALSRSLQTLTSSSVLRFPWERLDAYVRPRPGNLIIGLGAPGVGKSTFALGWAKELALSGEPVLYVSLDTPLQDQAVRLCASLSDPMQTTQQIEAQMDQWAAWLAAYRLPTGGPLPLRFCAESLSVDDLSDLVKAESEWFGEAPRLVVVDNATDLLEAEESTAEFGRIFSGLNRLARECGAVVLALHHIKRGGPVGDGIEPPTISSGVYAGERPAQQVLGLWRPVAGAMNVAVLKNRMGPAAPDASLAITLSCDLATSKLWEGALGAEAA